LRIWSRIPPTVLGGRGIVVLEIMDRFPVPVPVPCDWVDRGTEAVESFPVGSVDDMRISLVSIYTFWLDGHREGVFV
jgi:hypothetical protein